MSLRLEILQVARLARLHLRDSADLVFEFLQSQLNQDGGFKDRSGKSDLYYTVFGVESLIALQVELPVERLDNYLRKFGSGDSLDLVHLSCLARCWASLPAGALPSQVRREILDRLHLFRSLDGGFNDTPQAARGTPYGCFLALGACQDLQAELPNPEGLTQCLASFRSQDGAFANQPQLTQGTTPASAAAVALLRHLGKPVPPAIAEWLLSRFYPRGGFFATSDAPIPDLLSTATALHALSGLKISFDHIREPCLDYLDTLWSSQGSFYGNWADTALDCEYTYYGLLALGHLAV